MVKTFNFFFKSLVICRQLLQGQAKLVLDENAVLMEQLKIQETKAKDIHNQHVEEGKISRFHFQQLHSTGAIVH